jgi:hypothetical protein
MILADLTNSVISQDSWKIITALSTAVAVLASFIAYVFKNIIAHNHKDEMAKFDRLIENTKESKESLDDLKNYLEHQKQKLNDVEKVTIDFTAVVKRNTEQTAKLTKALEKILEIK